MGCFYFQMACNKKFNVKARIHISIADLPVLLYTDHHGFLEHAGDARCNVHLLPPVQNIARKRLDSFSILRHL